MNRDISTIGPGDRITINVCTGGIFSDNGVDSKTLTDMTGGITKQVTFSGLSSSEEYFIRFDVSNNSATYSFKGTISKN